MARARIELALAHVLRTQPFRDTSLLVEAFSQDHGRVGLVARGARAPKSRLRALLQPFQPLLLSWTEQGDLGSLTGAEAAAPPVTLAGEAVFCGWYLNELLLTLVQRHDPHAQLYADYAEAIAQLPQAIEPSLRRFELRLLNELGYGLDLPDDLDAGLHYRFDAEEGAVAAPAGAPQVYPGASLIALRDERFDDAAALRDMRRLLNRQLKPLLGTHELESARLLRALRARSSAQ
jgi:DNA repair protein RecO (recombination protein O)